MKYLIKCKPDYTYPLEVFCAGCVVVGAAIGLSVLFLVVTSQLCVLSGVVAI